MIVKIFWLVDELLLLQLPRHHRHLRRHPLRRCDHFLGLVLLNHSMKCHSHWLVLLDWLAPHSSHPHPRSLRLLVAHCLHFWPHFRQETLPQSLHCHLPYCHHHQLASWHHRSFECILHPLRHHLPQLEHLHLSFPRCLQVIHHYYLLDFHHFQQLRLKRSHPHWQPHYLPKLTLQQLRRLALHLLQVSLVRPQQQVARPELRQRIRVAMPI